jgi:hypothetical protein
MDTEPTCSSQATVVEIFGSFDNLHVKKLADGDEPTNSTVFMFGQQAKIKSERKKKRVRKKIE